MHMSRALVLVVGLVGGLATGCHARVYGHAHVRYVEPEPVVFVDAPDLVLVGDGVYVVQDYDYPVYYIDGYYYSYRGGTWYHTSHWSDPWVTVNVNVVPGIVVHRDHHAYVHYHGHAGAHVIHDSRPSRHASSPSRSRHASSPSHSDSHESSKPMSASRHDRDKGRDNDRSEMRSEGRFEASSDHRSSRGRGDDDDDDDRRGKKSSRPSADRSSPSEASSAPQNQSRAKKPSRSSGKSRGKKSRR